MAKAKMGAWVKYCGHNGCFVADIWEVGSANVVVANGPVRPENLDREMPPTHTMVDLPKSGYWRPEKGIFVVPKPQVKKLKGNDHGR